MFVFSHVVVDFCIAVILFFSPQVPVLWPMRCIIRVCGFAGEGGAQRCVETGSVDNCPIFYAEFILCHQITVENKCFRESHYPPTSRIKG